MRQFNLNEFKQGYYALCEHVGARPEDGITAYQAANIRAEQRRDAQKESPDKNWWKAPEKFVDGDEERLRTGRPTERKAIQNIRHDSRTWIPTVERQMTFAEIVDSYGVAALEEVLKEARTPQQVAAHSRRLGRPLKVLHKETHQTEPITVILAAVGD